MHWLKLFNYLLLLALFTAETSAGNWRGHSKYQLQLNRFDDNSFYDQNFGSSAYDQLGELRLEWRGRSGYWRMGADYQLLLRQGDVVEISTQFPLVGLSQQPLPNDDRRFLNLTAQLRDHNRSVSVHRLDRLFAEYSHSNTVLRVGRQAVSWGNGLIYNVLDFLNPFDPTAIDTDYKTGDDMVYGQYLRSNGDDIQALWVARRELTSGQFEPVVSSTAVKYHGFSNALDYDVLVAQHFDETVLGLAFTGDWGGALWRSDFAWVDSHTVGKGGTGQWVFNAVAGFSYSWLGWGKNMSLVGEYFYNGFGLTGGDYQRQYLPQHNALAKRLARGELYNLGRHYLAASLQVELTPLLSVSPNVFVNVADPSALLQLVARYSLAQDWHLLAALSVPVGPNGSEYGGIIISSPTTNETVLSTQVGAFVQLAWYF